MLHHLQTLVGLGPRPIASPANQAAADYIRETFCAAGLEVEEQPYAATAWEHRSTFLEQDGKRLDCIANAFSLPCDVTAVSCPPELEVKIKSVAAKFPGVVWVDPWPESNHSTFSFRGVPAIPIGSTGVRGLAHSVDDTLEQVSPAKLEEVTALVKELVEIFR